FRSLGGATAATTALSSVKSSIGHLGHAAGVASLIKAILALAQEQLPPTVNFTEPNPKLELDRTPFAITDRLVPWPRPAERPRLAGVSSFGVGGPNAPVVLEERPARPAAAPPARPRLVVWSAKSEQANQSYRESLARHFEGSNGTFAA